MGSESWVVCVGCVACLLACFDPTTTTGVVDNADANREIVGGISWSRDRQTRMDLLDVCGIYAMMRLGMLTGLVGPNDNYNGRHLLIRRLEVDWYSRYIQ